MTRRGQLVLLAAAALAIALVPMAIAHLQLGYHGDVQSATVDTAPLTETERVLHRALDEASRSIPSQYDWSNRVAGVTAVRDRLRSTLRALNTSRLERGTVTMVSYNQTLATQWAADNCPGGPNRQFGSCVVDRGIVIQERTGNTHVLAAVFDVRLTTPHGDMVAVSVVRTGGR